MVGFSCSSVGKESGYNAGDLGLIAGLGRSPGGGMATHSSILAWRILMGASLIAQLVKNPPAMKETLVQFLGGEDRLEKGETTHSRFLGLPLWFSWLRIRLQCGRPGFNPWVGKIPWRREWLSTPVFWPGELHGLYSPRGRKECQTPLSNFHFISLVFKK